MPRHCFQILRETHVVQLDSLHANRPAVKHIAELLSHGDAHKSVRIQNAQVLQQQNGNDCGVFVIAFGTTDCEKHGDQREAPANGVKVVPVVPQPLAQEDDASVNVQHQQKVPQDGSQNAVHHKDGFGERRRKRKRI